MPPTRYLAAFCIGAISSFYLPEQGNLWAWCVGLLLCAGLAFCLRRVAWQQKAACTFLCLLLGAIYAIGRTEIALSQAYPAQLYPTSQTIRVQVTGLPETDENGRTRFIGIAQTANQQNYRVLFQDYYARDWRVGDVWQTTARIRAAVATRNPAGFDREAWALANGIDGMASLGKEREAVAVSTKSSLHFFNQLRADIVQTWQRNASADYPQGVGLMTALAVGNRSDLSQAAWDSFRPLGLNHLISISGLHISMVGVLAAWLAQRCMRLLPVLPARPKVISIVVGWLAAVVYTGLAGWEIPALRSLIMLTVWAIAWLARGHWGVWQTWWAACAAVLLYQPTSVLAVGFWLSFGLVGALLWALSCRLPSRPKPYDTLRQAFIGQWAATLVGGIATIFLFGILAVYSPLVNAVAIPFFSGILTPLALVASALPFAPLQRLAAWLGEHTIHILLALSQHLPEQAFAQPPSFLFWLTILATLIILLPRGTALKPLACVIIASFLLYTPPAPRAPLAVHVWDVGQGLSVLLQTRNHNLLFDTGTPAAEMALLPNLRALGIQQIDTLVLSHHDNDHDGGYAALHRAIPIHQTWAGQPAHYANAKPCTHGTNWQQDGVWFEFLTPNTQSNNDNDQSCVLRIVAGEQALLIMGDVGNDGETALLRQYGEQLASQVLVLGHHGSKSSSHARFLDHVAPSVAIASSGFANHFRHPHPDVQQRLASRQIALWRTDTQGSLHFELGNHRTIELMEQPKKWWQRKPFATLPPS